MRLIILLLSLTFSCQLMAQEKFVTHDFIKGNIPSYKPAFNDSYPEWAKMLYQEKANFFEIQKNYMHWKLNSKNEFTKNNITLNQIGGVITFENLDKQTNWGKISLGITYNQTKNNFNEFSIYNFSNNNSIDSYFLNNANGLRLDQISAFDGESITDAYIDIGNIYGFSHQQAFLGYESFIIEPNEYTNDNSTYYSNIQPGLFNQTYRSIAR